MALGSTFFLRPRGVALGTLLEDAKKLLLSFPEPDGVGLLLGEYDMIEYIHILQDKGVDIMLNYY